MASLTAKCNRSSRQTAIQQTGPSQSTASPTHNKVPSAAALSPETTARIDVAMPRGVPPPMADGSGSRRTSGASRPSTAAVPASRQIVAARPSTHATPKREKRATPARLRGTSRGPTTEHCAAASTAGRDSHQGLSCLHGGGRAGAVQEMRFKRGSHLVTEWQNARVHPMPAPLPAAQPQHNHTMRSSGAPSQQRWQHASKAGDRAY